MKIHFEKSAIRFKTKRAYLIKIPKNKYCVWIPISLTEPKFWFYEAYLPQKMTFTLTYKNTKQKCSADSLFDIFNNRIRTVKKTEIKHNIPKKLKPKENVKVDDSLKR